MSEQIAILAATPGDAAGIATIYNHYVAETVVTFEEESVSAAEMAQRLESVYAASFPTTPSTMESLPHPRAHNKLDTLSVILLNMPTSHPSARDGSIFGLSDR
jgi:hypothetical protein